MCYVISQISELGEHVNPKLEIMIESKLTSKLPLLSFNPVNTSCCKYNTALDIFEVILCKMSYCKIHV